MIYIPRHPQFINAFRFDGYNESLDEANKVGITEIPRGTYFQCGCGNPPYMHGFGNGKYICPNTYVMYEGHTITNVMSIDNFESLYKPLEVIDAENKESGDTTEE